MFYIYLSNLIYMVFNYTKEVNSANFVKSKVKSNKKINLKHLKNTNRSNNAFINIGNFITQYENKLILLVSSLINLCVYPVHSSIYSR